MCVGGCVVPSRSVFGCVVPVRSRFVCEKSTRVVISGLVGVLSVLSYVCSVCGTVVFRVPGRVLCVFSCYSCVVGVLLCCAVLAVCVCECVVL